MIDYLFSMSLQSLFSCVPNLIFVLLLLLIPNLDSYGELTRSMATTGLQMFDVIVDRFLRKGKPD